MIRSCLLLLPVLALMHGAPGAAAATPRLLAVAWNDLDTGTGLVAAMSTVPPWNLQTAAIPVARHSQLRSGAGYVFAISRAHAQISVVRAADWTLVRVLDISSGGRPVDLAVTDAATAYITRDGSGSLLKLDLATGVTSEVVDLSGFADPDGNPDLGWMAVHEGRLFVQIRRVHDGLFVPPALIAVVDPVGEQVLDVDPVQPGIQAIALQGLAPKQNMQVIPETRRLAVLAAGGYNDDGGIELVDLDALASAGLVVDEATDPTGTDLESFVFTRPERGYLNLKTDIVLSSHLHAFSAAHGVGGTQLNGALLYEVEKMIYEGTTDVFFLPEGGTHGDGIRVFDAGDGSLVLPDPVPTNGSPTGLAMVCDGTDGCPEPLCSAPGACAAVPVHVAPLLALVLGLAGAARLRRAHGSPR